MNDEPQALSWFQRTKERKKGYRIMENYHQTPHRPQAGHLTPAIIKRRRIIDEHPLVNRLMSDNILAEAGRPVRAQAPGSRWFHMVTSRFREQEGWLL